MPDVAEFLEQLFRQRACLRVVAIHRFLRGTLDRLAKRAHPEGGRAFAELVRFGGELGQTHDFES